MSGGLIPLTEVRLSVTARGESDHDGERRNNDGSDPQGAVQVTRGANH
jgi:hypothetical protein